MYLSELKKMSNVEFILNSNVTRINGTDTLESIDIANNDGKETNLKVSGLFVAVGQAPNNEVFTNLVDLNAQGYFESEDGLHTKQKGVYIAGDARVKTLRQLTTAVSDGSIAATVAIREMREN